LSLYKLVSGPPEKSMSQQCQSAPLPCDILDTIHNVKLDKTMHCDHNSNAFQGIRKVQSVESLHTPSLSHTESCTLENHAQNSCNNNHAWNKPSSLVQYNKQYEATDTTHSSSQYKNKLNPMRDEEEEEENMDDASLQQAYSFQDAFTNVPYGREYTQYVPPYSMNYFQQEHDSSSAHNSQGIHKNNNQKECFINPLHMMRQVFDSNTQNFTNANTPNIQETWKLDSNTRMMMPSPNTHSRIQSESYRQEEGEEEYSHVQDIEMEETEELHSKYKSYAQLMPVTSVQQEQPKLSYPRREEEEEETRDYNHDLHDTEKNIDYWKQYYSYHLNALSKNFHIMSQYCAHLSNCIPFHFESNSQGNSIDWNHTSIDTTNRYKDHLPCLSNDYSKHDNAVHVIAQMFKKLRNKLKEKKSNSNNIEYEMEAKFGIITHGKRIEFKSGVSEEFNTVVKNMLRSYKGWHCIHPSTEYVDYFYDVSGTRIRTTVEYRYDQSETDKSLSIPKMIPKHICKQLIDCSLFSYKSSKCMQTEDDDDTSRDLFESQYDLKITLSKEETIKPKQIPSSINKTDHVRIKQRESFEYKPDNAKYPTWRIDLSTIWEGETKSQAENKRHKEAPKYEVECELLNVDYFLNHLQSSDSQAALSMILKVLDLYGSKKDYIYYEPLTGLK
jgi:hypothetical protein